MNVRFGACVALLAALPAWGTIIYIPNANSATEGTGQAIDNVFLSPNAYTAQIFVPSSMLGSLSGGETINGLAFRLDSTASTGPSSTLSWTNYDIVLSQPSATYTSSLGTLFSDNIGAGATTVRSGALSIAANSYTGGGSPNPFGPFITFTTPYTYAAGTSILITIRESGSNGADLSLDVGANFLGTESYLGAGYTATTGNSSIGRIPVIALDTSTTAIPEPGTLSLSLVAGLFALGIRSKRR